MRALFIGGNKSGKTRHAQDYTLKQAIGKPYYIATAVITDSEMQEKIRLHREMRADKFITIEEPLELESVLSDITEYKLIDCVSFWVSNMLYYNKESQILDTAKVIGKTENTVFVVNEVGACIIPDNPISRKFAHYNGLVAQTLSEYCQEVFLCVAGIKVKIK